MRAFSYRFGLGLASLLCVCLVSTICGCAPMVGSVMNASGRAYYERGNYAMARHEFERALADQPQNPSYAYNVAAAAHRQGDVAGAERLYRHAIALDPRHQPAYHGLAEMYQQQGRVAEAQDLMQAWVGTQPYLPEAHLEMAWMHRQNGNYAAAEQSLRQALQLNPQHPTALAHMGQLYHQTGRTAQAASMYQRSLYLKPNQPQVNSQLATLVRTPRHRAASYASPMPTPQLASPGVVPHATMMPVSTQQAGWPVPSHNSALSHIPGGIPQSNWQPAGSVTHQPHIHGTPTHQHTHVHGQMHLHAGQPVHTAPAAQSMNQMQFQAPVQRGQPVPVNGQPASSVSTVPAGPVIPGNSDQVPALSALPEVPAF